MVHISFFQLHSTPPCDRTVVSHTLPCDGHMCYFLSLAVTNISTVDCFVCVYFLAGYLQERFLELGIIGQKVNAYVILLRVITLPSIGVVSFHFSTGKI